MSKIWTTTIILFQFTFCHYAFSENQKLSYSDTLEIVSSINKLHYELYVLLPKGYESSEKSHPLIITQDVRVTFDAIRKGLEKSTSAVAKNAILVGMSYSQETTPKISRTRDFTPTYAPNERGAHSLEAQRHSGKANEYIRFIEKDVIPLLAKTYRINEKHKTFVGHSFGALLGAYFLLVNPELFEHYVLSSPSLWYDNKAIFRLEEAHSTKQASMPATVLMYIGEEESKSKRGNMVEHVHQFTDKLKSRNYQNLHIESKTIEDANHYTSFPKAINDALLKIYPNKNQSKPLPEINKSLPEIK